MALPVRRVKARPEVEDCAGRVALMRGPLVYAIETGAENPAADSVFLPPDAPLTPVYRGDLLGGVCVLQGDFQARFAATPGVRPAKIAAIPYYAYGNRGPSALRVWIPEAPPMATPCTIASKAIAAASFSCPTDTSAALNDGLSPSNSSDPRQLRFSSWDHCGTKEWVQYRFSSPTTVSAVEVYWWADGTPHKKGCLSPQSLETALSRRRPMEAHRRRADLWNEGRSLQSRGLSTCDDGRLAHRGAAPAGILGRNVGMESGIDASRDLQSPEQDPVQ
jgi:hypothetical protein